MKVEGLVVEREHSGGRLRVLDGLCLEQQGDEILGIIGPSGCGKTTLLQVLAGLLAPSSGQIQCADAALVFQRPTLLPWMSALDNALFGLRCRGLAPGDRERALAQLRAFGLAAHIQDHPHQLSEGMKQRVNLARALLLRPRLLLLDEPFSALDALTRERLQDELLARWQSARGGAEAFGVVLVSHALEEVARLADRVVVLSAKPTRALGLVEVSLPRPRGQGAEARLALYRVVEELHALLSSG